MKLKTLISGLGIFLFVIQAGTFLYPLFIETKAEEKEVIHVDEKVDKLAIETLSYTEEEAEEIVKKEFQLLEQAKEAKNKEQRLRNLKEFVHNQNEGLKQAETLVFGEYETTIAKSFTLDGKNSVVMSNLFHVAYGIDLNQGEYVLSDDATTLIFKIPESAVRLEHCMADSEAEELAQEYTFYTKTIGLLFGEAEKREQLILEAINDLNASAAIQVQKDFSELEEDATRAVTEVLFKSVNVLNQLGVTDIKIELQWIKDKDTE